jgi:hypothetical protein
MLCCIAIQSYTYCTFLCTMYTVQFYIYFCHLPKSSLFSSFLNCPYHYFYIIFISTLYRILWAIICIKKCLGSPFKFTSFCTRLFALLQILIFSPAAHDSVLAARVLAFGHFSLSWFCNKRETRCTAVAPSEPEFVNV